MKDPRRQRKPPPCDCPNCQSACSWKPGWFAPGEAEKAARYMKMTFREFFGKHLGIDHHMRDDVFVLAPAVKGMPPGTVYPMRPLGECVFFAEGKCGIHAVKPLECRLVHHNLKTHEGRRMHARVARIWRKAVHQRKIVKLFGRIPTISEPKTGEMIDMLMDVVRMRLGL